MQKRSWRGSWHRVEDGQVRLGLEVHLLGRQLVNLWPLSLQELFLHNSRLLPICRLGIFYERAASPGFVWQHTNDRFTTMEFESAPCCDECNTPCSQMRAEFAF